MSLPTFEEIVILKETGVPNIWKYLSEKYNESPERLRSIFRRESERRRNQETNVLSDEVAEVNQENLFTDDQKFKVEESVSYDEKGNVKYVSSNRVVLMHEEDNKNPKFVLKAHGFNPDEWTIVTAVNNYWQSMRTKDLGAATLFQSKITVKPKNEKTEVTIDDIKKWYAEIGLTKKFVSETTIKQKDGYRKMLLVPMADYHFGNGNPEAHIDDIIATILEKCDKGEYSDIYIVNMGDLLHVDNYSGQTTSGTQVGARGTYYSIWTSAVDALIKMISMLKHVAPVHFISINGNHDRISSFSVTNAVALYFNNDMDVSFDVTFEERKFLEYGSSVFGFLHGDVPSKNIPTILQREAKEMYGRSKNAYLMLGHLHHLSVSDTNGVVVYQLPSPTPTDEWHDQKAYTGAWKGTHCFVVDCDQGIKEVWHIEVEEV